MIDQIYEFFGLGLKDFRMRGWKNEEFTAKTRRRKELYSSATE
jgi:hypothetical protein